MIFLPLTKSQFISLIQIYLRVRDKEEKFTKQISETIFENDLISIPKLGSTEVYKTFEQILHPSVMDLLDYYLFELNDNETRVIEDTLTGEKYAITWGELYTVVKALLAMEYILEDDQQVLFEVVSKEEYEQRVKTLNDFLDEEREYDKNFWDLIDSQDTRIPDNSLKVSEDEMWELFFNKSQEKISKPEVQKKRNESKNKEINKKKDEVDFDKSILDENKNNETDK